MKKKKHDKVNIEKDRIIFFEIGLIITLAMVLTAFEWSKAPVKEKEIRAAAYTGDIEEFLIRTEREKPKQINEKPRIIEINLVPDETPDIKDLDLPDFFAEEDEAIQWVPMENEPEEDIETVPFINVSEQPTFMGEKPEISFRKFIAENVDYPDEAIDNNIQGRVTVEFVVDENGKVINVRVVQGVHPVLDEEAARVIRSSPLWKPGKQRTRPVRVVYYFPVNFRLE